MRMSWLTLSSLVAPATAGPIPKARPEEVGLDHSRLQALDAYLHAYVKPAHGKPQVAGTTLAVARNGLLAHFKMDGDLVAGKVPMAEDAIFRLYSMTKPVTAVTLMTFWEQAKFHLDDPVSMYLPAFADMRVLRTYHSAIDDTVPAKRPITIRHLLTHTSGLAYGFWPDNAVDKHMEQSVFAVQPWILLVNVTLADWVEQLAKFPLLFQPGTRWHYSPGDDVCGALVEALSGEPFQVVTQKRIFGPLGMVDTGFTVPPEKRDRLAPDYVPPNGSQWMTNLKNGPAPVNTSDHKFVDMKDPVCTMPLLGASGGGGLCSTTSDYLRFAMMLGNYGELDGVRVLAPRTVRLITANNLQDGKDVFTLGVAPPIPANFSPVYLWDHSVAMPGIGMALGGQVILNPVEADMATGKGLYFWGGQAGTEFFVDFSERMVVVFMQSVQDGGPPTLSKDLVTLAQATIVDVTVLAPAKPVVTPNFMLAKSGAVLSPLWLVVAFSLFGAAMALAALVSRRGRFAQNRGHGFVLLEH